jgi:hypothetical protein
MKSETDSVLNETIHSFANIRRATVSFRHPTTFYVAIDIVASILGSGKTKSIGDSILILGSG